MAGRALVYAYYAVKADDGYERVMHAVVGLQPKDARPITEDEAEKIRAIGKAAEKLTPPKSN